MKLHNHGLRPMTAHVALRPRDPDPHPGSALPLFRRLDPYPAWTGAAEAGALRSAQLTSCRASSELRACAGDRCAIPEVLRDGGGGRICTVPSPLTSVNVCTWGQDFSEPERLGRGWGGAGVALLGGSFSLPGRRRAGQTRWRAVATLVLPVNAAPLAKPRQGPWSVVTNRMSKPGLIPH